MERTAKFHLPGLFEFYDFYRVFLPVFYGNREYFYPWAEIGSIYGAPADCPWGGGRVGVGDDNAGDVLAMLRDYGISGRLTFSNALLRQEHLLDGKCNRLCRLFASGGKNGVILHSDLLLNYLRSSYPGLYFVSSTTKVLTEFSQLEAELRRDEFRYVVPDFRLNHRWESLQTLTQKEKVEFLCNECCWIGCRDRKACYEAVSRKALGEDCVDFVCRSPGAQDGYRFSRAMKSPAFIGCRDIRDTYLPAGFSNFKIEGRTLGSAVLLEFLLHYLAIPEAHLEIREKIYLDSSLDLF